MLQICFFLCVWNKAWARTREWDWGGDGGGTALSLPGLTFRNAANLKGQIWSPVFWGRGFCVHHTFLLEGWKGCPAFLYPQGPSVGPASFLRKPGGGFPWDLVAADLQIHHMWITAWHPTIAVAGCSGVTALRHLVYLSDIASGGKKGCPGAPCEVLYYSKRKKENQKLVTAFFLL